MIGFYTGALFAAIGFFIPLGKAVLARSRGEDYTFAFWDGGLAFRGRNVSAGTMIVVWGLALIACLAIAVAGFAATFLARRGVM